MKRLFVPLWYPPEDSPAGGFYRAKRLIESFQQFHGYVAASDSFPLSAPGVRRYPTRKLYSSSRLWFKISRVLNWLWSTLAMTFLGLQWREKFDAVYAGPSEILPIALAGWLVGRIRRVPVILCNLNVRDTELWFVNRSVHQACDAVITVSDALADELREQGIGKPIFVGTIGVDDRSLPQQPPQYDAIFVARLTEAKGIFDLMEIWRIVCDERPGSRLICAGPATPHALARIHRQVDSLNLNDVITFCGPVADEKWQLYAASRLCVFPSHVEGWGIVPIEAHLAGLPVVAYALRAYAETIGNSPGAVLVPCGDIKAFAGAVLATLSEGRTDRRDLRRWARRFTWTAAVQREEQILQQILESGKIARA